MLLSVYFLHICQFMWFQNSRNAGSYIPATQSQVNRYSEYPPSRHGDPSTAVREPAAGYAQAGVEQWVRQQNASRQKQEQMAASSAYAGQLYRSCDQIPEAGYYRYWSGHPKPMSSLDLARDMPSSVDFMGPARYGSSDAAMNVRQLYQENCKIPDDSLTLEQRQQRQSKIGRLQVIQQMISAEQQVPAPDERMDHMRRASLLQSRVAPVGWNGMPCDDDMFTGSYNSTGNQMVNSNYGTSAMRHQCHAPNWDMMTPSQRKWYYMQREHHMNQMGMQNNAYQCPPTDFSNSNVRYFEPLAPFQMPNDRRQLSVRDRVMPAGAMCDCSPVYPLCDPQACACDGGMPSHMGRHHMLSSGVCGYTDVGMQPNFGYQQQVNRCGEFMTDKYCMPVGDSKQLPYSMSYKGQTDGMQNWNSGENILKQRLLAAPAAQQFAVQTQQGSLTRQLSNSYCLDQSVVAEPVNTVVSCAPAQMPTSVVRQRQPSSGKKRKNNSSLTAASDGRSRKLDTAAGEWPAAVSSSRGGTLMNITSASLAHLAEGVANISAVMQQSLQHGGPFQSIRGPNDHADGSDENANLIHAGSSLQIQATDTSNIEENAAAVSGCTSVTSPLSSFQMSGRYSRCSSAAVSTFAHVHSIASTTGVDVVVMPKAPYTISYRPSGTSSGNVDVGNASAVFSQNARMIQQSNVARHMSAVDSTSFTHRHSAPGREGFSQRSDQEQSGMACDKNASDAEQQAAATDTCLSMASSVAVIQPQMMSGTQLFIADHRCESTAPVLNNYALPTAVPSGAFRSPQHSQCSLQHSQSY